MVKSLDTNVDGNITKEEAGSPPWFDRVDQNHDGVIDAAELEILRKARARFPAAAPRGLSSAPPTPGQAPAPRDAANGSRQDGFVPDAPFVGEVGGSYIDPGVQRVRQPGRVPGHAEPRLDRRHRSRNRPVQDCDRPRLPDGREHHVIFDRPPQGRKFSTNGPEWTRDDKGHLVVYTKEDSGRHHAAVRARLVDGKSVVTQLTHQKYDCYGNMPSRFQDGKPPRVAYTHDWPIWKAKAAWIFLDQPDAPRELANFDYKQMSMWSAVSPHFLFVQTPPGALHGQIAMSDADTGAVRVVTD